MSDPLLPGWNVQVQFSRDFGIATMETIQSHLGDQKVHHTIYTFPCDQNAIRVLVPISKSLALADRLEKFIPKTYPTFDHVLWFKRGKEFAVFIQKGAKLHYLLVFGPEAESLMLKLVQQLN